VAVPVDGHHVYETLLHGPALAPSNNCWRELKPVGKKRGGERRRAERRTSKESYHHSETRGAPIAFVQV
jgi:hypothetical protein